MQEAFQEGVSGRRFRKAFQEAVSGSRFGKVFREGVSGRRFGKVVREGGSGRWLERCFGKVVRERGSGRGFGKRAFGSAGFGEGFVAVADPFAHTSTVTRWVLQLTYNDASRETVTAHKLDG